MNRLDAKFIGQLFASDKVGAKIAMLSDPRASQGSTISLGACAPKDVDAKKFLKSLGHYIPPEEELLLLKKAIVANDIDVAKIFERYSDEITPE